MICGRGRAQQRTNADFNHTPAHNDLGTDVGNQRWKARTASCGHMGTYPRIHPGTGRGQRAGQCVSMGTEPPFVNPRRAHEVPGVKTAYKRGCGCEAKRSRSPRARSEGEAAKRHASEAMPQNARLGSSGDDHRLFTCSHPFRPRWPISRLGHSGGWTFTRTPPTGTTRSR